jgi:hypothetical protein
MSLDINLHCDCCGQTVAEINLTHNLRDMAEAAGLYDTLWGPYDSADRALFKASTMTTSLASGLERLRSDPESFKEHNPPNGWGDYGGLVNAVTTLLIRCVQFPDADVRVW